MRINRTKSKNKEHFSIIQDITINGKRTTKVYENIGNFDSLVLRAGNQDPFVWLNNYVNELNIKSKQNSLPVIIKKGPNKLIEKNQQLSFNVGYLFLQDIYYDLRLDEICNTISDNYRFKFDLNDILSKLIFARIIFPASKLKTLELSKNFLEQPTFEYQHIERALPILCENMDFIQSELYKNSISFSKRNDKILYYDCTNFYFEIEDEDSLRRYGKSKENRPNPITQMGMLMDGDGIPLAFVINPGNTNEQITLQPLEKKIIKDFELSQFVICTDAGLASYANRKFNDKNNRKFITTQSIKKLKSFLKEEALDLSSGWHLPNDPNEYNISDLRYDEDQIAKNINKVYFKERWINENGLEQRLIVTFSVKYQEYQRKIRNNQINRAIKLMQNDSTKLKKVNQHDPKRFIKVTNITNDGEIADKNIYQLNTSAIEEEAQYDGLYAVCTNLEDDVQEIIKVNRRRWEIEESFRIMKSDFKSRPAFHSKEEMIKAHFGTCFLALVVYRYLEKILEEKYTSPDIIETLRNMNIKVEDNYNYTPNYIRTDLTDELHKKFKFRTDYEIMNRKNFKEIFKQTKKAKNLRSFFE